MYFSWQAHPSLDILYWDPNDSSSLALLLVLKTLAMASVGFGEIDEAILTKSALNCTDCCDVWRSNCVV